MLVGLNATHEKHCILIARPWNACRSESSVLQFMHIEAVEQLLDVAQKLRQFAARRAAPKELVSLLQQQHGGEPSSLMPSLASGSEKCAADADDGPADGAHQQDQRQQAGGGGLTPATPQIGEAAMDTQT
jgi:hypothetical protein